MLPTRILMRCSNSTCTAFSEGDEFDQKYLIFPSARRISVFIPRTATVLPLPRFDVVLEMIWVFVGWSCRPCAAVAVVRSSSMVVVCFSEPPMRRTSSANLRFHVSDGGFISSTFSICGLMMHCKSELNKSVLSGSPCLVPPLEVEVLRF